MCLWAKPNDVVSDYGVKSAHVNGGGFTDDIIYILIFPFISILRCKNASFGLQTANHILNEPWGFV